MLKKNNMVSWLLAFCVCFAMAMPAFAATTIYDLETEYDISIVNEDNISMDIYEFRDFVEEAENEFEKESLEKFSNIQTYSVYDNAINEEIPLVFNMTVLAEEYAMTYYKEDGQEAVVYVYKNDTVEKQEEYVEQEELLDDEVMPMSLSGCKGPCSQNTNLSDGFGVRLPIKNTSGKGLTFTVVTSGQAATQLPINIFGQSLPGACYLYGGFSGDTAAGSYEADLGLVYQELADGSDIGWKPYFLLKKGNTKQAVTFPDSKYADVTNCNAYVPGDSNGIGIEIYPNYNSTYKVRLRTEGLTMRTNKYGGDTQKWLINIVESKYAYVFTNISKYKLLATSTINPENYSESDIFRTLCSGKFTKIAIGGSTPSFGSFETDYGYGTKHSSNSYTLGVCKGV